MFRGRDMFPTPQYTAVTRNPQQVATLSGLSTEKSHEQVLLKSIKNMQVQVIRYMNAGDDEIEDY